MSENHIFDIYYYFITKNRKTLQVKENICHVYGGNALTRQTAANWFHRFWDKNFNAKGALCSG